MRFTSGISAFVIALGISFSASADGISKSDKKLCKSINQMTQTIMLARQNGVPKSVILAIDIMGEHPVAEQIINGAVDLAFTKPIQDTPNDKKKAAIGFGTFYEVQCVRVLTK